MREQRTKAYLGTLLVCAANIASVAGISLQGNYYVDLLLFALMVAATVYGCWKNHNFSEAAQIGQQVADWVRLNLGLIEEDEARVTLDMDGRSRAEIGFEPVEPDVACEGTE